MSIHVLCQHFRPNKVPFRCTVCHARRESRAEAETHLIEKHSTLSLTVETAFTGTMQDRSLDPEFFVRMTPKKKKKKGQGAPRYKPDDPRFKPGKLSDPAAVTELLDRCTRNFIIDARLYWGYIFAK